MKTLRFFILLLLAAVCGTLEAQTQRELNQMMRERGEYYFTLSVNNPSEIQTISNICSVDGTDGHTVVAYANQREYDKLLQAGYHPNLQTPPSLREEAVMWKGGDRATYDWNSYLTYGDYVSMMEGFPSSVTNGANCTFLDLGTLSTSNHRRILGVRLNNGYPDGKPKFLYTSTMHGDEVTGMILMLRLINEFCTSNDSRIQNILDNVDLFIFPCTNPDGTYYGGNNSVSGARRYNGNNVDLNRHFPDFDDGIHPDGASYYQDEAQWMMDLAQEYLFTMGANYHGGAEVMNYPWDTYQPLHPDDAWWQYVSLEYVSNARANNSSYMTDTENNGITNGYAWYTITGSRQDYMNYYGQCREITIECSSTKTPSASQLPNFWNYNHIAMLAFIEQCLNGVHGVVDDAVTGALLEGVSVTVENHDALGSSVSTHVVGDFHRPIKGGTYTFTFAKQGYYSQSVQVTVADGQRVDLEIHLQPNLNLEPDFTASTTDVSLGQAISFTDATEGMVSSWNWTFEGATPSTSTEQNPTGIVYNTPGDYDVTLEVTGPTGTTKTKFKENYIHVTESILMQDGNVTTCSGLFYDSGGANSNYGDNLDYTMTFYPETPGGFIRVAFSQFNTESNYDYLYIYDGTSTSATLIGQYSGTTSPGTLTATNAEGALTFRFTSDRNTNRAGWVATVSCFVPTPGNITVSAYPARAGSVSGGGEMPYGSTCTVTATPNDGYNFTNWTENGTVVSENMEYSFMVDADRDLVANFTFMAEGSGNCYYPVSTISAGSFVMGYLNGNTLTMPTNNNTTTVTPTSEQVTLTEYGFTVDDETTLPQVTLTAYGSSQYYISYNGRYLARSNNGPTWTTSTNSSSTRWYINTNGIYVTSNYGSTNYYLYYNNGSFQLSTSAQNNITFYTEGNCPAALFTINATAEPAEGGTIEGADLYFEGETCTLTATANEGYVFVNWTENGVEVSTDATLSFQVTGERNLVANFEEVPTTIELPFTLAQGWTWWSTNLDITLQQLKDAIAAALGSNASATIKAQSGSITYKNGQWRGTSISALDIKQMYEIQSSADCEITLSGTPVNPAEQPITIGEGPNWISFLLDESISLSDAFAGFAVNGDVVKGQGISSIYRNGRWSGQLETLEPGKGYIFQSAISEERTYFFPTNK